MLIAAFAYRVLGEWLSGATLGKLLFGMRVVRLDGRPCGLGAAVLRTVFLPIDFFFFALPARLSMREPLNQRIGDRAASTTVINASDPARLAPRPWWGALIALGFWALCYGVAMTLLLLLYVTM